MSIGRKDIKGFEFFRRLWFWCTAKNLHGVHSPFVYRLNDECFNNEEVCKSDKDIRHLYPDLALIFTQKQLRLFYRLMHYLNTKDYYIWQGDKTLSNKKQTKSICVVLNQSSLKPEELPLHKEVVLWIHDIHKSNSLIWKQLQERKEVCVSIDLYRQGLIFPQRPQAKEHFKIRLKGYFLRE